MRFVGTLLVGYVLLLIVLTALQRKLLFFPTRCSEAEALAKARAVGLAPWRDSREALIGWRSLRPHAGSAHKLLVLHGNAGQASHRFSYVSAFENVRGAEWDVRILEYPGYGARAGEPGRESFREATRAALQEWQGDGSGAFLLGESVGGGVACDVAAADPAAVRGLILVTPFARLADVAQMHYPFLPIGRILRDRWDNETALRSYTGRVAMLIAGRDEVVGTAQGERLFASVPGPKRRWLFPNATHNDVEIQTGKWAGEVSEFLLEATPTK